MRTQLSEHVVFEDHPKLGVSFWHNTITGEFDRRIELNDAAEEKLLELLQARKEARTEAALQSQAQERMASLDPEKDPIAQYQTVVERSRRS